MTRILLAEDDPDIRHLVTFKLARAGFDVVDVADGFAAVVEARRSPPDLAILDVRMPRMSGVDTCVQLRADPETADIPIIILTARTRTHDIEAAFAAGATEFMVKPFSPRELLERVEALLARIHT